MTPIDRLEVTAYHRWASSLLTMGIGAVVLGLVTLGVVGAIAVATPAQRAVGFDPAVCTIEAPTDACTPPALEGLPPLEQVVATRARLQAERRIAPLRADPTLRAVLRSVPPVNQATLERLERRGNLEVLRVERELPLVWNWEPWDPARLAAADDADGAEAYAALRSLESILEQEHATIRAEEVERRRAVFEAYWAGLVAEREAAIAQNALATELLPNINASLGLVGVLGFLAGVFLLLAWGRLGPVRITVDAHRLTLGLTTVPLHDCGSLDGWESGELGGVVLRDGRHLVFPAGYQVRAVERRLLHEALVRGLERGRRAEDRSGELQRLARLRTTS